MCIHKERQVTSMLTDLGLTFQGASVCSSEVSLKLAAAHVLFTVFSASNGCTALSAFDEHVVHAPFLRSHANITPISGR